MKRMQQEHYAILAFAVSLGLTLGIFLSSFFFPRLIEMLMHGNRAPIYGTLAAVYSALLGFIITATSIILGYTQDPRFDLIKGSDFYDNLFDILVEAIKVLGIATVITILALVIDRDSAPNGFFMYPCIYVSFIVFFRVFRAVIAFQETVLFVARESKKKVPLNTKTLV